MPNDALGRTRADFAQMAGEVPELAQAAQLWQGTPQVGAGQGGKTTKSAARLNLRAVADVLERYGLDPIEEVAKVLTESRPLLDRAGNAVLDPETGAPQMVPQVDGEVRLRTLLELAQYTRAKLKATEVTIKTPELSDAQIDARLQALLNRQK